MDSTCLRREKPGAARNARARVRGAEQYKGRSDQSELEDSMPRKPSAQGRYEGRHRDCSKGNVQGNVTRLRVFDGALAVKRAGLTFASCCQPSKRVMVYCGRCDEDSGRCSAAWTLVLRPVINLKELTNEAHAFDRGGFRTIRYPRHRASGWRYPGG